MKLRHRFCMFRLAVWHARLARHLAKADEETQLELAAAYLDVAMDSPLQLKALIPGGAEGTFAVNLDRGPVTDPPPTGRSPH